MARRLATILISLLAAALVTAGCVTKSTSSRGTSGGKTPAPLTAGGDFLLCSDVPYPPAEFQQGSKFVGYDVEIANEIGKRIGVKAQFQKTGFDGIIAALEIVAFYPSLAVDTLTVLARLQATTDDPWRDAEPGKKKWQHLIEPAIEWAYAPELDNVWLINGDQVRSHYQSRFPTRESTTQQLLDGGTNEVQKMLIARSLSEDS